MGHKILTCYSLHLPPSSPSPPSPPLHLSSTSFPSLLSTFYSPPLLSTPPSSSSCLRYLHEHNKWESVGWVQFRVLRIFITEGPSVRHTQEPTRVYETTAWNDPKSHAQAMNSDRYPERCLPLMCHIVYRT
ncbi:hypothetical protein Pmani_032426 [Petrolisthes manimaculis]|uniref:Uncharacterized protein n=1 Tax=Petrolisthes manimaculis TaxID=1843537 RepID=A0AAE1NRR1_9EUCA|nr:hypothetical protein Pmani_032426 [Petrolisthes manimaculis]